MGASGARRPGKTPASWLLWALALSLAGCTSTQSSRQKRQVQFEHGRADRERTRRRPRKARPLARTKDRVRLDAMARQLGATPQPIERPCANPLCTRRVMDRLFDKLDTLDTKQTGRVRILQLGDSHIAADYITRTIRGALQDRFGDAGRGFVMVGQRTQYGGRAIGRSGWKRTRAVDADQLGKPFGVSGMVIQSTRAGAEAEFRLEEEDVVSIHYQAHPDGRGFTVRAESEQVGEIEDQAERAETRAARVSIPMHRLGDVVPPERLEIRSKGRGTKIFGLSFEQDDPGIIYDAIGPVGVDAAVYLGFEQSSLRASMRDLGPDLVVLMIGGNDALAVRKAARSLDEVRQQHVDLIEALRQHSPDAECLIWAPMDAGEELPDGTVITKRYIEEIRNLQRETALELGCAFWDTFESMGGHGSFGRWLRLGIMNKDMVHPRSKGGDLMGHLFARAFMNAYLGKDVRPSKDDLQATADR